MNKTFNEILGAITRATDGFQATIPEVQEAMINELMPLIKDLQIRNGRILNNLNNLKIIGTIKNKLQKVIVTAKYSEEVGKFMDSYDDIANLQAAYFSQYNSKFTPGKTLPLIKNLAIETTANDLIGQGMKASVLDPIISIITQNVTTGGSYADFNQQLRNEIMGNDQIEGSLMRYTRQMSVDAINQYSAQYADAIAQDLNFNWMIYRGSLLTTSREFCIFLTKKTYIHRSELPEIIKGNIDGHQCKLSKRTELPLGMIPGTNEANFNIRRGGYTCGHQAGWVPDTAVPIEIRNALAAKQATPPEEKPKPAQINLEDMTDEELNKWHDQHRPEDFDKPPAPIEPPAPSEPVLRDANGNIENPQFGIKSTPGKEQTIISPNGRVHTGIVEQLRTDQIRPSEDHAIDPDNGTAQGYADGEYALFSDYANMAGEVFRRTNRPLTTPDQLPPSLLSSDGILLDGNNRYNALTLKTGINQMNVIRIDKTYREYYGRDPQLQLPKIERPEPEPLENRILDTKLIEGSNDQGYHVYELQVNGKPAGQVAMEGVEPGSMTITDAFISERYKGTGLYKEFIFNIVRKNPDKKIYSVFRSDEAKRAWDSFMKKLPADITGREIMQDGEKVYSLQFLKPAIDKPAEPAKAPELKTNYLDPNKKEHQLNIDTNEMRGIRDEGLTEADILGLVGGIPNADTQIQKSSVFKYPQWDRIQVTVNTNQYTNERAIYYKEKRIYNDTFFMKGRNSGSGIGLNAFLNQIKTARKLGFLKLETSAGRSANMNGYYTWARFGYRPKGQHTIDNIAEVLRMGKRKETSLDELMRTKDGQDFWKDKGVWFEAQFDLTDGSESMRALQAYLAEKGINVNL